MNTTTIRLPRAFVLAALASLYIVAFLLSPYWTLADGRHSKAALLATTLILGAAWCICAAAELKLDFRPRSAAYLAALCAGVFALNYRALGSGLPWRGDEDFHILRTLQLVQRVPFGLLLAWALLVAAVLIAAWHKSKWALVAGAALLAAAVIFGYRGGVSPQTNTWMLRYPFVNYWIFMLVPKISSLVLSPYQEMPYRVVPLLAMSIMAWAYQDRFGNTEGPNGLLWGLVVATVPLVFYYSSILYLEPLATALMLIACLRMGDLLRVGFEEIRNIPAWYALVILGFIKETAVVFLLCFIACRLVVQLKRRPLGNALVGELSIVVATCVPIGLYLSLRSTLGQLRSFDPDPGALFDPQIYRALGQSYLEQFGLMAVLFVVGLAMLARRREYVLLLFFGMVGLLQPMAYAVDQGSLYAGYSRFNLLVLPAILAGALIALRAIVPRIRGAAALAAGVLIAANLLITPVHADGTKAPYWGNYLFDTSEHYYPFREAITWLRDDPRNDSILFAGWNYGYHFEFYFRQLQWRPRFGEVGTEVTMSPERFGMHFSQSAWQPRRNIDELMMRSSPGGESSRVSSMLRDAAEGGFQVVVYQVLGRQIPHLQDTGDYQLARVFSNQAHSLMVFIRQP
jgi:hypothetical protein